MEKIILIILWFKAFNTNIIIWKIIKPDKNKIKYCNPKIQNEFIQLISNKIESQLVSYNK